MKKTRLFIHLMTLLLEVLNEKNKSKPLFSLSEVQKATFVQAPYRFHTYL